MKKKYSKELSLKELASLTDDQIDTSDIPALDEKFWDNARLVEPDLTKPVTLRVKASVLEAYKSTGKGWQTRMNTVLESYASSKLHKV